MKTNTSVAIDKEVWKTFGLYAIIKGKNKGELIEELIKKVIKDNDKDIQKLKAIQNNS